MSITNYSELKTAITDWTHRSGLTAYVDDFIDLAEAKMNRSLRLSEMENTTVVSVTSADLSFPADFLEMRQINVSGSPDTTLEYITPYQYEKKITTETGKPRFYTIMADAIKLFPSGTYDIEMVYYKKITALDGTNTSNFVINSAPDLYLHGALSEAYIFARNADNAKIHADEFKAIAAELNLKSRRKKFSGTPLQVVAT